MSIGLYAINEIAEGKVNLKPNAGYATLSSYTNVADASSIDIYVKAINKIQDKLSFIEEKAASYHKLIGNKSKENEASDLRVAIINEVSKINAIVYEFLKAYTVAKDKREQETFLFFYDCFFTLYTRMEMFFLKFELKHLKGLKELCQDLCSTYLDIKKELEAKGDKATS